ncbi:MAG: hypothetical protein ACPG5T_01205 [Endozoicomonas sp.]
MAGVAVCPAGFLLYLLFGSPRLGTRRLNRIRALYPDYTQWYEYLSRVIAYIEPGSCVPPAHGDLFELAGKNMSVPLLPGNHLELFHDCKAIIDGLLCDIEGPVKPAD